MKHVHYADVELETPDEKDLKDVKLRWLISEKDGAENFAMRLFEIQPEGYTPLHQHDWEHEVFILKGGGVIRDKEKKRNTVQTRGCVFCSLYGMASVCKH